MKPKIVAIIQARMAASRLPGKVLLEIEGRPMLGWVVERTRLAHTIDEVVVATTDSPTDDLVEAYCREQGYACCRGSQYDVLDRYYQAARLFDAGIIVRITADCPLIDPGVIDATVSAFLGQSLSTSSPPSSVAGDRTAVGGRLSSIKGLPSSVIGPYDFAANRLPPPWKRTFPVGLDTEVCSFAGLETAWREAQEPHQREHVMPFFYEQPERFRILHFTHDPDYGELRWTVDTPADLVLVQQIAGRFPGRIDFTWLEVLDLVQREPELGQINAEVQAKNYREVDARHASKD
jgi:spore coat polysaccharide biosynthesis protein SpsF